MSMAESMKKDIGKHGLWFNNTVIIIDSFTCYAGDFYVVKDLTTEKTLNINIWEDDAKEFLKTVKQPYGYRYILTLPTAIIQNRQNCTNVAKYATQCHKYPQLEEDITFERFTLLITLIAYSPLAQFCDTALYLQMWLQVVPI